MAQLIMPPPEVPVTAPVPVVPNARVVEAVPVVQLAEVFTLKPAGKEAVPEVPMLLKFSVVGDPKAVIDTCPHPTCVSSVITSSEITLRSGCKNLIIRMDWMIEDECIGKRNSVLVGKYSIRLCYDIIINRLTRLYTES